MPEIFRQDKPKSQSQAVTYRKAMMSAFMVEPHGVRFQTQETDETVFLLLRQHPVTNVGWIIATLVLILIPPILSPIILSSGFLPKTIPLGLYIVSPLLWYLGTFGFAFSSFLSWYFNVYIVTNKQIVDIDWVNLLYRQISSAQLEKIQDVSYKMSGIIDSFFDFGTVLVQTAGTDPNFEFDAVPNPERVVRKINELIGKHENKTGKSL